MAIKEEAGMPLHGWSGVARCGLPGFLLGLVLMWMVGDNRGPIARAQTLTAVERVRPSVLPGVDPSGTIAFTSPTAGTAQLLYLIDTRAHAFAVYRIDPANPKGLVKLEAARQYQWDLKLA